MGIKTKKTKARKTIINMKEETISGLKKKAWKLLSKLIRLQYSKNGYVKCYTCGKLIKIEEAQAGHGLSGRGNSILFDREIIRPQCVSCNIFKRGAYDEFHRKLIEENGLEWFNQKLKQKRQTKQFTRQELKQLIEEFSNELKKLTKNL